MIRGSRRGGGGDMPYMGVHHSHLRQPAFMDKRRQQHQRRTGTESAMLSALACGAVMLYGESPCHYNAVATRQP